MLLYVLTHDYSGRLGRSAIGDKGIVYHIYSLLRTDGRRSWATISTGVDPDKADAMEAEVRAQLARLASDPPSPAEVDAARNHLLGRDLTAAQSNEELTAKLAREFLETRRVAIARAIARAAPRISRPRISLPPLEPSPTARSFASTSCARLDQRPLALRGGSRKRSGMSTREDQLISLWAWPGKLRVSQLTPWR